MIIKVTEDHIKNGLRCTTSCCPVALALQEISPNVRVGLLGIWLDIKYLEVYIDLYEDLIMVDQ